MVKRRQTPWQVESLRLSAFVADRIDPMQARYWETVFGAAPHEIRRMPHRPLAVEEGLALTGRVRAHVQPNRVDWHLVPDPAAESGELPVIGSYDDSVPEFQTKMKRWLTGFVPIARLAFAAILLQPAANAAAACRILAPLLPRVQIDAEETSDFIYRINRRRESRSGAGDLAINPLSTWSVLELTQSIVDFSSGGASIHAAPNRQSVVRLELDINTAPDDRLSIEPARTAALLDELVGIGAEIAANGDLP